MQNYNIKEQLTHKELLHESIRNYQPTENCLVGKNILITGAGDGIGRVAALTYARYGATVLLLGKTSRKLDYVYDEIESFGGNQPAILPMNLDGTSLGEMQEMADKIASEIGQLDGLLHNAGVLGQITELENYDIDVFNQVMQVNFTSTFMLTQSLLPLLKQASNASVIFTSSGVSKPRATWGAYALSKLAVEGMSELFTLENQETGLRFNCVNPGATRTSMRALACPDEDPMTLKTAEEIMSAYLCLMSEDSVDIRGEIVNLQPNF